MGPGRWSDALPTWGDCVPQASGRLSCSDLGRAKNAGPSSLPLYGLPENLNLSGLDLGSAPNPGPTSDSSPAEKAHAREQGQTQCGRDTASTSHTCQWYLLVVSLCPHSSTEQVSLNKWPPSPPCVRTGIRHWREQQMEEAKINRGNCFGSDRCNRLKPCS